MSRKHRAPQSQGWAPRDPRGAAPPQQDVWPGTPPGAWPGTPPGRPSRQPPHQSHTTTPPRKRRRIFLWIFLAVQILFLAWVIFGAASAGGTPEECRGLRGDELQLCENAGDVGTTIGVGLVIGLWVAADFILALTYVIYRLASRQPRP
ncbi:hypothetical protein [Streptomyces sp. NPDC052693]|uniref:hypothetical protein n=1 Tax=Streptomyces sp. NPDC052693 TaxID=3155814 RepID=UPI00341C3E3E